MMHIHPHINALELVESKTKSTLSYKELMQQFGKAYSLIQDGVINQDTLSVKIGIDMIQNHPAPKSNPWSIVKNKDIEAFKETLLYYDNALHTSATKITKSLKTNNWITINQEVFQLSNHCINCHIIWKDNLMD